MTAAGWRRLGKGAMPYLLIAGKLGAKALKMTKVIKGAGAGLSMVAYAYLFTWEFALVIVASLCIHEWGHVWAMRRCGVPSKGFYLIPFVGAAAIPDGEIISWWDDVLISLAGPAIGLVSAGVAVLLYLLSGAVFWAAVASWVALLNLFQLFPIVPLDGGRVARALAYSSGRWPGLVVTAGSVLVSGVITAVFGLWLFGLFCVAGTIELLAEYQHRTWKVPMSPEKLINGVAGYLGLVGIGITLVVIAKHVPGADLALHILQDR